MCTHHNLISPRIICFPFSEPGLQMFGRTPSLSVSYAGHHTHVQNAYVIVVVVVECMCVFSRERFKIDLRFRGAEGSAEGCARFPSHSYSKRLEFENTRSKS
jgi:hypothetical protein